ncbi:alpha/beta fold hydrolase [Nocardia brasiliensis]
MTTSYDEFGQGSPLVFLHGGEGLDFRLKFADLLSRFGRVIAPIHPGFLGTPRPPHIQGIDDLVDCHLTLLDELDLTDVTLVGHSFGSWVTSEIAMRNSIRIARYVLLAPTSPAMGATTREILQQALRHPEDLTPDMIQGVRYELESFESLGLDQLERVSRILGPTLVIAGTADHDFAETVAARIPNAVLALLADAGHLVHRDAPDEVCRLIGNFIDHHS